MEFHPLKCQVISIINKIKPCICIQYIHNCILEQVNYAKYLGVYINSKLTFNTHVQAALMKANSMQAFLARNIVQCNKKVKQTVYTIYIRPVNTLSAAPAKLYWLNAGFPAMLLATLITQALCLPCSSPLTGQHLKKDSAKTVLR